MLFKLNHFMIRSHFATAKIIKYYIIITNCNQGAMEVFFITVFLNKLIFTAEMD